MLRNIIACTTSKVLEHNSNFDCNSKSQYMNWIIYPVLWISSWNSVNFECLSWTECLWPFAWLVIAQLFIAILSISIGTAVSSSFGVELNGHQSLRFRGNEILEVFTRLDLTNLLKSSQSRFEPVLSLVKYSLQVTLKCLLRWRLSCFGWWLEFEQ